LAAMIAAEIKGAPERPKLKLIRKEDIAPPRSDEIDPVTKDFIYRRVRDLARMYWLGWLVRQETQGRAIECLEDDELRALLRKMEQARECRIEGIGFDEVPGLVRDQII
jgi:hypothetical protein